MAVICPPNYRLPWKEIVEMRRNQLWTYMAWLNQEHCGRIVN